MSKVIGGLAVAGVLLTAACASAASPHAASPRTASSRAASSHAASPPAVRHTGMSEPDVVAWVNRPAPPWVEPTPTPLPTDARPCRASDLTASSGDVGAAMGTTNIRIDFKNHADTACVLLGYPTVAGISSDGAVTPLTSGHGSITGDAPWPAANIAPGETAAANISGADACDAALRGQRQVYPTLRIGLPSGDKLDVPSHGFDTVCGVRVSQFGVPADQQPPQVAPSPLIAHITAPTTVRAGEDLTYTVTLHNGGHADYPLTICPAYEEYLVISTGAYIHPNYYLNCDTVHDIPAGSAVTYQMELQLPADLGETDAAKFGWHLQGDAGPATAEIMQITN